MPKFLGFPVGDPVTMSVTQGDETKGPIRARRWATPDARHTLQAVPDRTFAISVTIAKPQSALVTPVIPKMRLMQTVVEQIDGRKISVSETNRNDLRDVAWIGAQADVYRVVSGVRTHVGAFTVTAADFGAWFIPGNDFDTAYDANGRSHFSDGYGRPDEEWDLRTRWFGVAAVDSSNRIGAIGSVAYTPTSLETGDNLDNDNTIDLGADYTTGGSLAAPANITATPDASGPATALVTHDPVTGAIGYMHFLTYDDPATHPAFKYVELDGDGVQIGDEVIIRQRFLAPTSDYLSTRTMVLSDGQHGGRILFPNDVSTRKNLWTDKDTLTTTFVPYDGPVTTAGDWAVRYQFTADAPQVETQLYSNFWNADPGQSFYYIMTVGETYRFTFQAYVNTLTTLKVNFGMRDVPDTTVTLVPGWQTVRLDRTALTISGRPMDMKILVTPQGSALDIRIAGFHIYKGTTPTDTTFRPDIEAQLLPGIALRDGTFVKPLPEGYFIEDLVAAANCGYRGYSVHQYLATCAAGGYIPWLQIEPFLSPSEWEWFGDYLCAPVSSGRAGALRRQSLGREAPWVDAFAEFRLEFGNEAWNGLTEFYNPPSQIIDRADDTVYFNGDNYGLMCRQAALAMMDSEYWSPKIGFTLGAWARFTDFGERSLRRFDLPCHVGIANYNGGWDVNGNIVSEDDASYQNVLSSAAARQIGEMDALVAALQSVCTEIGRTYQTEVRPTCYEAGPGYQMNGLNGASVTDAEKIVQEVVMKSRATGTATMHTALAQAARGFAHFNFFTVDTGDTWKSHAPAAQGGATFPAWQMIRKLHELFGVMRVSDTVYQFPERIVVKDDDGNDLTVDATYAYGLTSVTYPQRKGFALGSVSRAKAEICTVATDWTAADNFTGWILSGAYDDHNRYPVGQRLSDDGSFVPDPNSVNIEIVGMSLFVPSDLGAIASDDGLAFTSDGIPPGNCGLFIVDD